MTTYTGSNRRFCSVFKSPKKQEMYVYIERSAGIESLPEALISMFGQPEHVLDMVLTPDKKLARADAKKVLESIEEQGFYLQMPPGKDEQDSEMLQPPKDSLHG